MLNSSPSSCHAGNAPVSIRSVPSSLVSLTLDISHRLWCPQGSDGFSLVLHGSQLFLVSRGCGQIGSLSWSHFCRRAGILLWGITEIRESPLGHEWRNHAVRLASRSEWQDGNPSSLQQGQVLTRLSMHQATSIIINHQSPPSFPGVSSLSTKIAILGTHPMSRPDYLHPRSSQRQLPF